MLAQKLCVCDWETERQDDGGWGSSAALWEIEEIHMLDDKAIRERLRAEFPGVAMMFAVEVWEGLASGHECIIKLWHSDLMEHIRGVNLDDCITKMHARLAEVEKLKQELDSARQLALAAGEPQDGIL